jgi:hypothetical protein
MEAARHTERTVSRRPPTCHLPRPTKLDHYLLAMNFTASQDLTTTDIRRAEPLPTWVPSTFYGALWTANDNLVVTGGAIDGLSYILETGQIVDTNLSFNNLAANSLYLYNTKDRQWSLISASQSSAGSGSPINYNIWFGSLVGFDPVSNTGFVYGGSNYAGVQQSYPGSGWTYRLNTAEDAFVYDNLLTYDLATFSVANDTSPFPSAEFGQMVSMRPQGSTTEGVLVIIGGSYTSQTSVSGLPPLLSFLPSDQRLYGRLTRCAVSEHATSTGL